MTTTPAGTPPAAAAAAAPVPVPEADRNRLLDALRGAALLGILLMNVPGFAMPDHYADAFRGDPANPNFWAAAAVTVAFEGKMRALFGMIFGAGVVLFAGQKERAGKSVAGLFYRRMGWLAVFGLAHAHLILWVGDILYPYAVCGAVVYLARNARPAYLALAVPLVAVLDFGTGTLFYRHVRAERLAYVDARAAAADGRPLTPDQADALARWRELELTVLPNREDAANNTRTMKSDYPAVAARVRPLALQIETVYLPLFVGDSVALMLLGIALYRWGFLTGGWSGRAYRRTLLVGYGVGLPLVVFAWYHAYLYAPDHEAGLRQMEREPVPWVNLVYPFQRILLVLAHVAALVLLYQSGVAAWLFRRLEAVGRMAFTNYVTHSAVCSLLFFGYGLNLYAELEYYQLFFVVAAIWVAQLAVSPVWLRYFRFGPLEWAWRSLTYWKPQPFRR